MMEQNIMDGKDKETLKIPFRSDLKMCYRKCAEKKQKYLQDRSQNDIHFSGKQLGHQGQAHSKHRIESQNQSNVLKNRIKGHNSENTLKKAQRKKPEQQTHCHRIAPSDAALAIFGVLISTVQRMYLQMRRNAGA